MEEDVLYRFSWPVGTELLVVVGDRIWTGQVLARYVDDDGIHDVHYPGDAKKPVPAGVVVQTSDTGAVVRAAWGD